MKAKIPPNVKQINENIKIERSVVFGKEIIKNENDSLKNEILILRKDKEDLKKKLDDILNKGIKKIEEKNKIIDEEKIKTFDNSKSRLNRNVTESKNYDNLLNGEKLIALNFISVDQCINHTIICKTKAEFHIIEAQLYAEYPEYKNNENFFTFNGSKINRWNTLEDNGINGIDGIQEYIIMLNKIE